MLLPDIFLPFLLTPPAAALQSKCWAPQPLPTPPPPQPPDCHYILAHLPIVPSSLNTNDTLPIIPPPTTSPFIDHNAPFLPYGSTLHHASCIVLVNCFAGPAPEHMTPPSEYWTIDAPISPTGASRIWAAGKQAAEHILIHCVEALGLEGLAWGGLDVDGVGEMWYAVEVLAGWRGSRWADAETTRQGRMALRGEEVGGGIENMFFETFYEV